MKKWVLVVLLLGCGVFAFAQDAVVLDELAAGIANDGRLTVVARRNLGAQFILSGSLTPLGNVHRVRIQAIHVETARIQTVFTANVKQDSTLAALLKGTPVAAASSTKPGSDSAVKARASSPYSYSEGWKNKWLYLSARFGGAVRFYNFSDSAQNGASAYDPPYTYANSDVNPEHTSGNFEAAFQVTVQMIPLFALQTEFVFSGDNAVTDFKTTESPSLGFAYFFTIMSTSFSVNASRSFFKLIKLLML
jgi:hypothetical protein